MVARPSAVGGGWRRFMHLTWLIGITDWKLAYFDSVLGYLWSLARPLLLFAVLLEVFTHVIRLGSGVLHYPVLLLMNIVLFGFFQEGTNTAVGSVLAQEAVVRKTQFPRLVIPLAVVLTSVFNLLPNLIVVFAFILGFGVAPMWTWLLLPVLLVWLFTLTTAVAMILSALYPRFRDMGIIWAVFSTALFYATPVLYTVNRLQGTVKVLIGINPLTPLLEHPRRWIIDFGNDMTEADAAFFEAPFEYVLKHVRPTRLNLRRQWHRTKWWLHGDPRPALRRALLGLNRYILTPRVAKHRLFVWRSSCVVPDSAVVAFARDDDTSFGVLHSRFHEAWSLRLGTWLGVGNDPRYTPSTAFETFPFPSGLTPNLPASTYTAHHCATAVAEAANRLNELTEKWLNPPDLLKSIPDVTRGFP